MGCKHHYFCSSVIAKLPLYHCGHVAVSTTGLPGKKCSFVSAVVKLSGGNWELQRPLTIVALSSSRIEDEKQFKSWTCLVDTRQRQAAMKEIAYTKLKLLCRVKLRCAEGIKK